MLKCSDCKHAKIPGHSCEKDMQRDQVADLLETFGMMAAGFCAEFSPKEPEDDDE